MKNIRNKRNRRKSHCSLKRKTKRIILHQIELQEEGVIKEVTTSFHSDPENQGMIKETICVPYTISKRNMFY